MNQLSDWAPVFGSNTRDVEEVKKEDLQEVNVPFNQYGISEKETLIFKANEMRFAKQAPAEGSTFPTYLVSCYRNGNKSWFNPGFLIRQNVKREPIYPKWAELGSAAAVVDALAKIGTLKGGKNFPVQMPERNRDRTRKQSVVLDENGNAKLNDDGTPMMKDCEITRQYPTLPDPIL